MAWTEPDALRAVSLWIDDYISKNGSIPQYKEYKVAASNSRGSLPGPHTIRRIFGGWGGLMAALGILDGISPPDPRTLNWSEVDLMGIDDSLYHPTREELDMERWLADDSYWGRETIDQFRSRQIKAIRYAWLMAKRNRESGADDGL